MPHVSSLVFDIIVDLGGPYPRQDQKVGKESEDGRGGVEFVGRGKDGEDGYYDEVWMISRG